MRFRYVPSRFASRRLLIVAVVGCVALLTAACGDDDASPSDTTTGVVDRSSTTTTTAPTVTTEPSSEAPVGLWLSAPTGISTDDGDRFATPAAGETLRSPVDDGHGGVYYLRCTDASPSCAVEHVVERNGTPMKVGEADDLLALGTFQNSTVLLTSWTDPARVPSFEGDVSGLVARALDRGGRLGRRRRSNGSAGRAGRSPPTWRPIISPCASVKARRASSTPSPAPTVRTRRCPGSTSRPSPRWRSTLERST